jgi:hypothetical protein
MWNLFQDFSDSDWENRARQSFISFSWEVFVGSLFISNGFSLDPHRDI